METVNTTTEKRVELRKKQPVYSAKYTGEIPVFVNNEKLKPCNRVKNNRPRPNFPY